MPLFSYSPWALIQYHPARLCRRLDSGERQRLDSARGAFNDIIFEESVGVVGRLAPAITPCHVNLVAVDIDVSPFDNSRTKKEGVSWTYKKFDGYAPIFGYVAEEGYLANLELRPGSDHSQKGTEAFLRRTLRYACMMSEATFLVRMDSGNDSMGNIKVCREEEGSLYHQAPASGG